MITIGMLHHRKYPHKVIKSYAFAAVAKAEGAELIFFSPKAVDFEENIINGYIYEHGSWQARKCNFPDVIYNAGSPDKLAKSKDVIDRLKRKIPFTTNSLGSKLNVFERLKKVGKFSDNIIPYQSVRSAKDVSDFIDIYESIVFKPVMGQRGRDIIFITAKNQKFEVREEKDEVTLNSDELEQLISERIISESYLMQPYIKSRTKDGMAYDFRLHVQKDIKNNWVLTAAYPRIAPIGSIVSNISKGGFTSVADTFLKNEFGDEWYNVKSFLEQFALQLAKTLDEIHLSMFNEQLDELGIDVGIDKNKGVWIYEVNWRPGCPPAMYLELDVVKNTVGYAMYLANNGL